MRTQTYIFLQKLRCPKCGRILAGGATHKIKYDKIQTLSNTLVNANEQLKDKNNEIKL